MADSVFAAIDLDHNGVISPTEGAAYAKLVVGSLSLNVDGQHRALMPGDERIRITAQSRDTLQNEFKMEFKVNER